MGDQTIQRQDMARKASIACQKFLQAYYDLLDLAARRPYMGGFVDADFTNASDLKYLDAGTVGVLFDNVVPDITTALNDVGNSGRMKQILNQISGQF